MQPDLKHKRKAAGFIRTNSTKALPTFKIPDKSESSDDFSSFENSPNHQYPQQQDSEFSPYKNPNPTSPHLNRPPLPHQQSTKNPRKQLIQSELFTNQKLKRNYQTHQTNNCVESPGQIVDRSKSRSNREEQIRDALRKRVQVQKEIAQINQIYQEIDQFRPHISKQKQQRIAKQFAAISVDKGQRQARRQKPSFSHEKQNLKYQLAYNSIKSPKYNQGSQNKNILNKQRSPRAPQQKIPQSSSQKYNFEQSQISSNSSESAQQQYQTYHCEQTFKPNANQQILISIEQYKKLHPEFEGSKSKYGQGHDQNQDKKKDGRNDSHNRNQIKQAQVADHDEDRIRHEHEKARRKFISNHEQSDILEQSESKLSQSQEQQHSEGSEQSERLIQQYPTTQFKKTTLKETIQAQRNLMNQSPTFVKSNPTNTKHIKSIENSSGIHKARGGICFDLDINQFTQHDTKPAVQPKLNAYASRKPKKANTKEEILKRRQMAKNYDKEARARVFAGY